MHGASLPCMEPCSPWNASVVYTGGKSVLPMLGFMAVSLIAHILVDRADVRARGASAQLRADGPDLGWDHHVHRRAHLSVPRCLLVEGVRAPRGDALAGTRHRHTAFIRRRRPWTEKFGVITREKQLADDLNDTDHAEVVWFLEPDGESPLESPRP